MDMSLFQILAAILMVGVACVLFVAIRRYMAAASERRMMEMLDRVGLDPAIAEGRDTSAIMKEVRQRCRSCSTEAVCERWLAGDEKGGNLFCPNARVFSELKRTGAAVG
jgi:hypothetical protein